MNSPELLNQFRQYDNKAGYKLNYKTVKKRLQPIIKEIKEKECLDILHDSIKSIETWSCQFALEILKEIKSEKSIVPLISFLKNNNSEGEYLDNCEEAMDILQSIGKPAINHLIDEINHNFKEEKYYDYLVGALTGIKDGSVYQFMAGIIVAYAEDPEKYYGWLDIADFTYNFEVQENKEILPLLEKISNFDNISNDEKAELESTILVIKDPEKFNAEIEEGIEGFSEVLEDFKDRLNSIKKDPEKFLDAATEPDYAFEANFICHSCHKRQNLKTGQIWQLMDEESFAFEFEIMCKCCFSHDLELSDAGKESISRKGLRVLMGLDKGIMPVKGKLMVEDKKMQLSKAYGYLLKRIEKEPNNGELYLRAANTARKKNLYDEAIGFYKRSLELNPKLIASYINLIEIFLGRDKFYGMAEEKPKAELYFSRLIELYNSFDYDSVTISDEQVIDNYIHDFGVSLGISMKWQKLGRNEPCHCGSGIKYKKCCLNIDEKEFEKNKAS